MFENHCSGSQHPFPFMQDMESCPSQCLVSLSQGHHYTTCYLAVPFVGQTRRENHAFCDQSQTKTQQHSAWGNNLVTRHTGKKLNFRIRTIFGYKSHKCKTSYSFLTSNLCLTWKFCSTQSLETQTLSHYSAMVQDAAAFCLAERRKGSRGSSNRWFPELSHGICNCISLARTYPHGHS